MKFDFLKDIFSENFIKNLATTSLVLIFFIFLACLSFFSFQAQINVFCLPLGLLASFVFSLWSFKNIKQSAFILIFILIFLRILFYYFSNTYDSTSDSLEYHVVATGYLLKGYNPFDLSFNDSSFHKWIVYFPKASWIISAAISKFFNNLQCSKLLNVYLIYTSFLYVVLVLKEYKIITKNKTLLLFIAFLAALNPVALLQIHTFLVDSHLASLLLILVCSLALYVKNNSKFYLFSIFMSVGLCLNIKLSAIAYVVVILGSALFFIKTREDKIRSIIYFAVFIFVSLFFLGFNPYTKNLLKYKNPFYPIGSHTIDIVGKSAPGSIENKNRFTKFFVSTFSQTTTSAYNEPELKFPLSIKQNDMKNAFWPQPYMSGFGIFFSAVFLATFFCLILLYKESGYKKFLLAPLAIIVSVFINPEAWWARFVPQLYIIPFVILCFAIKKNRPKIASVLLFFLSLNLFVTGFFYLKKTFEYQKASREVTNIIKNLGEIALFDTSNRRLKGVETVLENLNVHTIYSNKCEKKYMIRYLNMDICATYNEKYMSKQLLDIRKNITNQ